MQCPWRIPMRIRSVLSALAVGLFAVSATALADDMKFAVASGTVQAGEGQAVMFKGSPLPLSGKAIKVGDPMPSATLTGAGLAPVNIAEGKGKVRILNVVPSLDTPTCDAQTHELVEKDP